MCASLPPAIWPSFLGRRTRDLSQAQRSWMCAVHTEARQALTSPLKCELGFDSWSRQGEGIFQLWKGPSSVLKKSPSLCRDMKSNLPSGMYYHKMAKRDAFSETVKHLTCNWKHGTNCSEKLRPRDWYQRTCYSHKRGHLSKRRRRPSSARLLE